MKNFVLCSILLLNVNNAYAQKVVQKQTLLQGIEYRDAMMGDVSKKDLPDSLKKQVADFRQLTDILISEINEYSSENQDLKNELHKYFVLTTSDTLIFHQDFTTVGDIPLCLKERVDIVNSIIELRTKIVAVEDIAQELERSLGSSPIAYAAIREKIEKKLDGIQTLIHKIKEMNLNTLSDEQQKYFRPNLTDRYNNFKKYF